MGTGLVGHDPKNDVKLPSDSETPFSITDITNELENLTQRIVTLESQDDKRKVSIEERKAELLPNYINNTFWFCVAYSVVIGIIVLMDGFSLCGFDLDYLTTNILIGSSVIGLLSTISKAMLSSHDKK